ncbi:MAG: hypothetical protein AAGC76_05355 [Luteibacter sp.]|uniref:hypothetical protein n=1 Tax=Luteibacter sp. TaxID=1886636 RepID=UPI0028086759|nr:hypothetical protein [Luteibacter sp.]MDQ7995264.1 hypothetical protein [Luteibacter sp.]
MDIAYLGHTLRIAAVGNALEGTVQGYWAVFDGPPDDGRSPLYEDITVEMSAWALAHREAKAESIGWIADHGSAR